MCEDPIQLKCLILNETSPTCTIDCTLYYCLDYSYFISLWPDQHLYKTSLWAHWDFCSIHSGFHRLYETYLEVVDILLVIATFWLWAPLVWAFHYTFMDVQTILLDTKAHLGYMLSLHMLRYRLLFCFFRMRLGLDSLYLLVTYPRLTITTQFYQSMMKKQARIQLENHNSQKTVLSVCCQLTPIIMDTRASMYCQEQITW